MLKINYNSFFRIILILSAIKILFSIYLGDEAIDMEWGIINQNLVNFGEFSYYEIDSNRIPSIYMPPLYSYFLYSFSFLNLDQFFTTKLIIITQCLLSLISALVFFRLLRNYFDDEKGKFQTINSNQLDTGEDYFTAKFEDYELGFQVILFKDEEKPRMVMSKYDFKNNKFLEHYACTAIHAYID